MAKLQEEKDRGESLPGPLGPPDSRQVYTPPPHTGQEEKREKMTQWEKTPELEMPKTHRVKDMIKLDPAHLHVTQKT